MVYGKSGLFRNNTFILGITTRNRNTDPIKGAIIIINVIVRVNKSSTAVIVRLNDLCNCPLCNHVSKVFVKCKEWRCNGRCREYIREDIHYVDVTPFRATNIFSTGCFLM